MRISSKCQSKRNSLKFDCVKSNQLSVRCIPVRPHVSVPTRPFCSTAVRRADPLTVVVGALGNCYTPSILNNPLAGMFISLVGMGSTLFLLALSLPGYFGHDLVYSHLVQRLDSILLLCERFLLSEHNAINVLLANIGNFTPETLYRFYLLLQELVAVRESLFSLLDELMNSPEIEFLPGPVVDRIMENFENLRMGGNNLMGLIREIESRLNIPSQQRIPPFWFEG